MIFDDIDVLGRKGEPFFFMIDFCVRNAVVKPLKELAEAGIGVDFNGNRFGLEVKPVATHKLPIEVSPIDEETYKEAFGIVRKEIEAGNSYLLNLTFPTEVRTGYTLEDMYAAAKATYKVYSRGSFVFYSPEPFVRIRDGRIFSFPMKGTADAKRKGALKDLMESDKELYEHYTIVDLIRNDLALVSEDVIVDRFRYYEKIETAKGREIYQTSSAISGVVREDWKDNIGGIMRKLLPAGSICGAPKKKTLEIINKAEIDDRGYYSGVTGVFDGEMLESCVNIRYIEQKGDGEFRYRSGGGITCRSNEYDEYEELKTKVYVPSVF